MDDSAPKRERAVVTMLVEYEQRDGLHVFRQRDVGLFLMHEDCRLAFDDVGPALEILLTSRHLTPFHYVRSESYEEFVSRVAGEPVELGGIPQQKAFVLERIAA